MRTSARLLAATGALVVAGLVVPATALAEEQTKCEEAGKNNTPVTVVLHEAHEETEDSLPAVSEQLHDAETLTCAP